jgi:hypothetical protein
MHPNAAAPTSIWRDMDSFCRPVLEAVFCFLAVASCKNQSLFIKIAMHPISIAEGHRDRDVK